MTAYADTSVLLRVVLGERGALREWRSIDTAVASELVRVEALRTLDRARIRLRLGDDEVAARRADVLSTLEGFRLAQVDGTVLDRAAEPFPTLLRTLDAIHLATALLLRPDHPDLVLATHDAELAAGARAEGLRVLGT